MTCTRRIRARADSGRLRPTATSCRVADFEAQLGRPRSDARPMGSGLTQFTFDDGGVSYYTVVADRLEAQGWRGHCFVSTDFIGQRGFLTAAQIRELDARGHVIGSHSASHPARFSTLTAASMRARVGRQPTGGWKTSWAVP